MHEFLFVLDEWQNLYDRRHLYEPIFSMQNIDKSDMSIE